MSVPDAIGPLVKVYVPEVALTVVDFGDMFAEILIVAVRFWLKITSTLPSETKYVESPAQLAVLVSQLPEPAIFQLIDACAGMADKAIAVTSKDTTARRQPPGKLNDSIFIIASLPSTIHKEYHILGIHVYPPHP